MGKPPMFAPNCCGRCHGAGWVEVIRNLTACCYVCGGTGKRPPASAYDTLPCDSEPRDLPSNENVIDTPISGEPK